VEKGGGVAAVAAAVAAAAAAGAGAAVEAGAAAAAEAAAVGVAGAVGTPVVAVAVGRVEVAEEALSVDLELGRSLRDYDIAPPPWEVLPTTVYHMVAKRPAQLTAFVGCLKTSIVAEFYSRHNQYGKDSESLRRKQKDVRIKNNTRRKIYAMLPRVEGEA
jgi:hypothetical protein